MTVKVNVLYLPGTNCHRETLQAFKAVGAAPSLVFLDDLLRGAERLSAADIVCLPGGFSFGDHVGAGNVAAQYFRRRFSNELAKCSEMLSICICNGFQVAARAGLFGAVSLRVNANATFHDEARQRHIVEPGTDSPWLAGLAGETLVFPCAHGEGRFEIGGTAGWKPVLTYPPDRNPDGSMQDIAGVTTENGLVLGLMNHPERSPATALAREIFRNGVRAASF